jgi:hypothetical protein
MPDAAANDKVGRAIGIDCLFELAEMVRPPNIVVADVTNPFSAGAAYAVIVRAALAAAVALQISPPNPWAVKSPDNRFGVIGARIANDEQFKVVKSLLKNGFDAGTDMMPAVIGGHDHRKIWISHSKL